MMEQNLPKRSPPGTQSFDTRPDAVDRWIADLPMLKVGETSRQLYNTLLELNSLEFSDQDRFATLEKLRVPIQAVIDNLKQHYLGHDFPLDEKSRRVSDLCKAMYEQLATGYRIVISDQLQKGRFRKDTRMIATALHRAMASLGLMLLNSFQVYAPYPPHVWREIHELYRIADEAKLQDGVIKDTDTQSATTVSNLYKQILLLALACPYRMRQGTVEIIYEKLKEWSADTSLSGMLNAGNPSGMFVINLMSDDPPTYLILNSGNFDSENSRILNTGQIDERVSQEIARLKKNGSKLGDRDLHESHLRRLLLAWGVMPKRKFTRHDKESTALVAMGLSAAHYFVSGEQAFHSSGDVQTAINFSSTARYSAAETRQSRDQGPDLWELGSVNRQRSVNTVQLVDFNEEKFRAQQEAMKGSAETDEVADKPAADPYQTKPWQMVNVSAGGYRLLWDSREGSKAEVGELIGIRESNEPDSFHMGLGVIRWMKVSDELGVELGVQMISPGAVAVGTRQEKGSKEQEYLRSLLLPEIAAIGQPATLITPTLPYRAGDRIVVNSHGKELMVELVKLVENTGTFAQFQFRALQVQAAAKPEAKPEAKSFEKLWQEI